MNPDPSPQPSRSAAIARVLGGAIGVAPNYRHVPKHVSPGNPLELPAALLKWYEVHAPDRPVPREISGLARKAFDHAALNVNGLGFVVLHRCGEDFYFLIVNPRLERAAVMGALSPEQAGRGGCPSLAARAVCRRRVRNAAGAPVSS